MTGLRRAVAAGDEGYADGDNGAYQCFRKRYHLCYPNQAKAEYNLPVYANKRPNKLTLNM